VKFDPINIGVALLASDAAPNHMQACSSVQTGDAVALLNTLGPLNIRALEIFLGYASPGLMDLFTLKI
jgi:hypothetical protein